MTRPSRRRADGGVASTAFTLVELLAATAVLALLLILLMSALRSVSDTTSQTQGQLNATRLGREILDVFGRDLAQIVSPRPALGNEVPLQFVVNPPQANASFENPTAVFWQSAISKNRSAGNIAVVGYFVHHPEPNRAQLRRVLIEPTDPLYQIYENPDDWLPATTLEQFISDSTAPATNIADRGWLADGVLGLWVRCLDANGNVILYDGDRNDMGYRFDSRLGFQSEEPNGFVFSNFNALPAFVEIGIVCVAPQDVDQIDSLPSISASSPLNFHSDIQNYTEAFTAANPRVKTAIALTKRFRVHGSK